MILGINIDENYACVNVYGNENVEKIPFAIGKNIANNSWFIGDEAKLENVDSSDIVIDKLYYLLENDGVAKIGDTDYTAKQLTNLFINNLMLRYKDVEYVTIAARSNNIKILSKLKSALLKVVGDENKIKVTTYSESFVSYIKSKATTYYDNPIALFNFTEKALTFYELVRFKSDDDVEYWKVNVKEHLFLPLDLLSGDTGKKVCDNLLNDFARECMKEPIYNNIVLAGIGFVHSASYREFMTYVCSVAEVETDIDFFSKATAILSNDLLTNNFDENVVLMTDARTTISLKVNVSIDQKETKLEIIKPGVEWFNIHNYSFDIIVDNEKEIKFEYLMVIEGVIKDFAISFQDAGDLRIDKSNEFKVSLTFEQQNILHISITDNGFGEFYEPIYKAITRTVTL